MARKRINVSRENYEIRQARERSELAAKERKLAGKVKTYRADLSKGWVRPGE